jgi:transcriptional regulator GlxA family with amidase domain
MGVDIGPPLTEKGNFFENVCRSASHFSFISRRGQVSISLKVLELCGSGELSNQAIRVIHPADKKFLNQVMACLEDVWDKSDLNIAGFARELGMSKSQLARRLNSLSALSPNDFVKEFRLRKAIHLMEEQRMNIAEVTMAVGFTNPSYFAKCFRKRFGKAPSDYKATA